MYYNLYKYDRFYNDQQDRITLNEKFSGSVMVLQSNCSVVIPPDDNLVKTDEAIIVIMVFALWAWAIGLFIHRWGKIRSIAYVPSFEAVQREMEEKMRKERLSEIVTDAAQTVLLSRQLSTRRPSFLQDRHSSFSNSIKLSVDRHPSCFSGIHDRRCYQARRRPHGVLAAGAGRRYSCDTRLLLAWPSRGQSQVTEATIDEDVETTEPGSLANLQPGHDSDSRLNVKINGGPFIHHQYQYEEATKNGNICSASTRFSDV